jgi:hypothetical protein
MVAIGILLNVARQGRAGTGRSRRQGAAAGTGAGG